MVFHLCGQFIESQGLPTNCWNQFYLFADRGEGFLFIEELISTPWAISGLVFISPGPLQISLSILL
jgi:hypothetical protein